MISFVRIDDRLIHGQVVIGWTRTKSINFILAVDDEVATNKMQVKLMKMATPPGVKSEVLSANDAVKLLQSGKLDKAKVFLVTKNPSALISMATQGIELPSEINVGNVREKDGLKILPYVLVKQENIPTWKEFAKMVKMSAQLLPDQPKYNVNDIVKGM